MVRKWMSAGLAALCCLTFWHAAWAQDAETWREFAPQGAGFKCQMPSEPQERTQSIKTDAGEIKIVLYLVEQENSAFLVNSTTIPGGVPSKSPEKRLDEAQAGAAKNVNGKIVESVVLPDQGTAKGRRLVIEQPSGLFVHARLYVVGNRRLIQAVAVGPTKEPTPEIERFLASFVPLKDQAQLKDPAPSDNRARRPSGG